MTSLAAVLADVGMAVSDGLPTLEACLATFESGGRAQLMLLFRQSGAMSFSERRKAATAVEAHLAAASRPQADASVGGGNGGIASASALAETQPLVAAAAAETAAEGRDAAAAAPASPAAQSAPATAPPPTAPPPAPAPAPPPAPDQGSNGTPTASAGESAAAAGVAAPADSAADAAPLPTASKAAAADDAQQPQQQPTGEYAEFRPLFELGNGQFGVVWLLQHHDGRKIVDKRVVLAGLTEEQKRDTGKEIELLRRLEHRYVVRYYDSYEDDVVDKKGATSRTLHILMEYCDEGALDARIADQKVPSTSARTAHRAPPPVHSVLGAPPRLAARGRCRRR